MKNAEIHETRTRVRYQETDQMGVVYHSNYLVYFELGRTELMRAAGVTYRDLEAEGYFLAVTKASMRFIASARYDDSLVVRTRVARTGKASIEFAYEVCLASGESLATGTTELACLNRQKRPVKFPASMQAILEKS